MIRPEPSPSARPGSPGLLAQLGNTRRANRGLRWVLVLGLSIVTGGGAPFFIAGATVLAGAKTAPKAPLLVDGDLDDALLSRRPNKDRRRRRRSVQTTTYNQLRDDDRSSRTLPGGPPGHWGPDLVALVSTSPRLSPPAVELVLANLSLSAHTPVAERLFLLHCSLLI
jgi:hypothetical protein